MAQPPLVEVVVSGLETIDPERLRATQRLIMEDAVAIAVPLVRRHAPRRTGRLQASITGEVRAEMLLGGWRGVIRATGPDAFRARFVALGTGPRENIEPRGLSARQRRGVQRAGGRGARALRFSIGGETVYAARVKYHPGTRAVPFYERAAEASIGPLTAAANRRVAEALGDV